MKRWLYLVHRWLGIPLCAVMALWFLSGIVMLYVGYPKLTPQERQQGLPPLAAAGCCVPLAQALQVAGLAVPDPASAARRVWRLSSVGGQPRYLFSDGAKLVVAVDARSGQRITQVSAADALATARHFAGGAPARHLDLVSEDAWTHSRALDAHRPLHRVAVDDAPRRWLYISSRTGEVVRDASRTERTWGWVGAWLHWLYVFRGGALDAWWTDIVVWLAIAASVLALSGGVVGLWRWRFRGRYRSGARSPYPVGVARWHHMLGLAGGALALTWALSGLLSMNPWKLFDAGGPQPDRAAYAGAALHAPTALPAAQALARLAEHGLVAQELEWRRVGGVPFVLATGPGGPWVVDAQGLQPDGLPATLWLGAAARLLPQARIVAQQRSSHYDAYYYAREPHTMTGQRERPLPVWRLQFDDPNQTWVWIDPRTGTIVQAADRLRRIDRWAFAFLHSFDLPALLAARPAWDAWMLGFSAAGLALSLTGLVSGWRRVRRRLAARPAGHPHRRQASPPPSSSPPPSPSPLPSRR